MATTTLTANLSNGVTTSYGGENIVGFRVLKTVTGVPARKGKKLPTTLAEANRWLIDNAVAVDKYARSSTKRLIGRESV